MTGLVDTPFSAFFLEGRRGPLFALHFAPIGEVRGKILCIPPFTEESNRCRAMLGMAARTLAQAGFAVLLLDPYATGDSAGEFEDAAWEGWLADVASGMAWLADKPGPLCLWGTRLSAILVFEAARQAPDAVQRLLLWQPVANGKLMFTQYLRLRVATSLETSGQQETTNELRERLAAGEALEVGGYYISPRLAADLDALQLPADSGLDGVRIDWLERVDEGQEQLSVASNKLLGKWQALGMDARGHTFNGPPFWQLHERFLAPQLLELSREVMCSE